MAWKNIDWGLVHFLALRYQEHIAGECEDFPDKRHGADITYDREKGFLIDDRCEEQVLISNNVAEHVSPYMPKIAGQLLNGSFILSTPNGRKFIRLRRGNNINTIEDLAQEGIIGVIRSLGKFDNERKYEGVSDNNHMRNFVRHKAAGAMIRSAHNTTLIRIPVHMWYKSRKVIWESKGRAAIIAMLGNQGFIDDDYSAKGSFDGMRAGVLDINRPIGKDGKRYWQDKYLRDDSAFENIEEQLISEMRRKKSMKCLELFQRRSAR